MELAQAQERSIIIIVVVIGAKLLSKTNDSLPNKLSSSLSNDKVAVCRCPPPRLKTITCLSRKEYDIVWQDCPVPTHSQTLCTSQGNLEVWRCKFACLWEDMTDVMVCSVS